MPVLNQNSTDQISGDEIASDGADRPLAVFDLDGTLTLRDTFLPFLMSYGRRYRRVAALLSLPFPIALYVMRLIKDSEAKERLLISFFAGQPMERIDEHADWFCRNWLPSRLNPTVVSELKRHQEAGDRVILLSASPSIYVPAVARSLGVDEVVCTQVAMKEGRCLGRLAGPNCKGSRKLELLKNYLMSPTAPPGSSSYGDSRHDIPVLQWVSHGWLVRGKRLMPVPGREPV